MLTEQELRQLCLLAAAGGLAGNNSVEGFNPRRVHTTMRCVLYMLVAFSLRRRNLGRRNLRTGTDNPNSPNSSRLRYSAYGAATFRSKIRSRLSSVRPALLHKQGCLAITYM
jgi:hypothetical protein